MARNNQELETQLNMKTTLTVVLAMCLLTSASHADSTFVPGTSNPWLAGMPNGSTANSGDIAPTHSPVLFMPVVPGSVLSFLVTGSVNNDPFPSGLTPDGGRLVSHSAGAENGIANFEAPFNSLLGVFLDGASPTATPAPSAFAFVPTETVISPELKQVFFIGDGLTGTGSGIRQEFVVPTGATRFFLGTMDTFGWYNNFGGFEVTVVPEPGTSGLLAVGLVTFLIYARRSRYHKAA